MEFFVSLASPATAHRLRHRRRLRQGHAVGRRRRARRTHRRTHRAAGEARRPARQDRRFRAARRPDRRARANASSSSAWARRNGFKRKQYRKALASALAAVGRTGAKDAVSYLGARRRRRCRRVHAGAHRRRSRGELAVPHPRPQDLEQAAEAVADPASASPSPNRGDKTATPSAASRTARASSPAWPDARPGQSAGERLHARLPGESRAARSPASIARSACAVLNEAECRRLKMGSFLSVTAGTEEPAYLIVLEYQRRRSAARRRRRWSARA